MLKILLSIGLLCAFLNNSYAFAKKVKKDESSYTERGLNMQTHDSEGNTHNHGIKIENQKKEKEDSTQNAENDKSKRNIKVQTYGDSGKTEREITTSKKTNPPQSNSKN
jgi:hypothetical protein